MVSNVTVTVPVLTLLDGSVIVTVGLVVSIVHPQITFHPVLGVGTQLNHGIVAVSPLATFVHVTVVPPLVKFGFAVQIGVLGAVVSCTVTVLVSVVAFPLVSTFLYSNTYTPGVFVSTVPLIWNVPVAPYVPVNTFPVPSTLSLQLAPASL